MHLLTAVISPTMQVELLLFINRFNLTSYATLTKVQELQQWFDKQPSDVTAARHDELPHRGSVRASYVEAWGGAATTDGSGARFKARRVVDPERASHRCHYHHGLAPSPALTPTRHHCNCDPISPHRSSIHSQTLLQIYYRRQVPQTGYIHISQVADSSRFGLLTGVRQNIISIKDYLSRK